MKDQFRRKILHVDMDAFYASVEEREHPALVGKPLIIARAASERGVVSACSYAAREYGIHSGMPTSQAIRACKDVVVLKPRMALYKSVSKEIMAIFKEFAPEIEPIAFDEAFLDISSFTENWEDGESTGRALQQRIFDVTSLTSSIGLSFNKFLAKIGSAYLKPNGFTMINQENYEAILDAIPVRKLFGIGKVTEQQLLKIGITTGKELKQLSKEQLTQLFKSRGERLYDNIRGLDMTPLQTSRVRKSLGKEKTFPKNIDSPEEIFREIRLLTLSLYELFMAMKVQASRIRIKVRLADFSEKTRTTTFISNIHDKEGLCTKTALLFKVLLGSKFSVRKIAIYFTGLNTGLKVDRQQGLLFN